MRYLNKYYIITSKNKKEQVIKFIYKKKIDFKIKIFHYIEKYLTLFIIILVTIVLYKLLLKNILRII